MFVKFTRKETNCIWQPFLAKMDEIDSIMKCFDVVKANKAHTIGYLDFDVRFILFFVPMNTDVCNNTMGNSSYRY